MPWWGMIVLGCTFITYGAIQWGFEHTIEKHEDTGVHTYEIRDLEGNTVLITKNPAALNKHYKIVKKEESE